MSQLFQFEAGTHMWWYQDLKKRENEKNIEKGNIWFFEKKTLTQKDFSDKKIWVEKLNQIKTPEK